MKLHGLTLQWARYGALLVLNRRARRAVHGLVVLRRSYEHLLATAVLEGARDVRGPYYQDYVDAMEIIGARAEWVAKTL